MKTIYKRLIFLGIIISITVILLFFLGMITNGTINFKLWPEGFRVIIGIIYVVASATALISSILMSDKDFDNLIN